MQKIIAVIGNANIDHNIEQQKISYELGKMIIDNGYILATGGLGGVMEYASNGAKKSSKYQQGSIIGFLPNYIINNQNSDIAIPTGMGLARNLLLISSANAVIAIGGCSGTLNEISASWQMNKLIIGLKIDGWSKKLCGQALDKRRDDIIFCAKDASEAIKILNDKILDYQTRKFLGVNARISQSTAKKIIKNHFSIKTNLSFLGKGKEGFIFSDKTNIFKVIDNSKNPLELYWTLLSLSETSKPQSKNDIFPAFSISFASDMLNTGNDYIFIKYKNTKTDELLKYPKINIDKFIDLLKKIHRINWVFTDFKPQNIRATKQGHLLIVDIGRSFLPLSDNLFKSMCRRAFVTYKLQDKLLNPQQYKQYLSSVNKTEDFALISAEYGLIESELKQEFNSFYHKIITTNKKDILNPIIANIFQKHLKTKSVLDYGSGYGDMSKLLQEKGVSVSSYEPDKEVLQKNKEKYYQGINILDKSNIEEKIKQGLTFEGVLCSLVLCHKLAETKQQQNDSINQIMSNITQLSSKYVVIVICNPLYTYQTDSALQVRFLPDNFNYQNHTEFTKKIHSSNRERVDIHRPLSFYEKLFQNHKLKINKIIQTNDKNNKNSIKNSDFMIFILQKYVA